MKDKLKRLWYKSRNLSKCLKLLVKEKRIYIEKLKRFNRELLGQLKKKNSKDKL